MAPHRAHADRRLVAHPLYWQLGNTPFAREAAYAARVAEGVSGADAQALAQASQHGWVLGEAAFLQQLEARSPRRLTRAPAGRPAGARAALRGASLICPQLNWCGIH
jgi:putative transposase